MDFENFFRRLKEKDRVALAKIITLVDNETSDGIEFLKRFYRERKESFRIGITGPPGVGKSTLVNKLIERFAKEYEHVSILAVDPSSPFTGGAILGDRLRMDNLYKFDNVYMRSVASRGSLGGLSSSTENILQVLEIFGTDIIFVETVGVGQSELDVMEITDLVMVILVPESGDSIQAMKAGIMEIGDIFVVNKSDREGAEKTSEYIKSILQMKSENKKFVPPVINVSAKNDSNLDKLVEEIENIKKIFVEEGILERKKETRKQKEIRDILRDMFIKSIDRELKIIENTKDKDISPYEISEKIFKRIDLKSLEDIWKEK